MYYEEKIIGGVLHWRGEPEGEWKPVDPPTLSAKVAALREDVGELVKLLSAARCPNSECDGNGVIAKQVSVVVPGCCERFLPSGECCGIAVPMQGYEVEFDQCQWCTEKQSLIAKHQPKGGSDEQ